MRRKSISGIPVIDEHKKEYGLRWLLRHMGIYPNAYYNYRKNRKAKYRENRERICESIRTIYHNLKGIAGHRTMGIFLLREGVAVSKTTVHKYMNKELGLHCICRRKKPGYRKSHAGKIFSNILNREFQVSEANRVWCMDFTYLHLENGDIRYNCAVLDLYDRSIVASENDKFMTSSLAKRTLEKAILSAGCSTDGLILHSDQGSQFTSEEFILYCKEKGIVQSMSRAGCPYDNSPMERYFNTMKTEFINQYTFGEAKELDCLVSEFAYVWYNQIRPHSYNNYMTPYEKRFNLK